MTSFQSFEGREFQRILAQAAHDLRGADSYTAFQAFCVGIYCCRLRERWPDIDLVPGIQKLARRALRQPYELKVPRRIVVGLTREGLEELKIVYRSANVTFLVDCVNKLLDGAQYDAMAGLPPCVLEIGRISFLHTAREILCHEDRKLVDIALTQAERLIKKAGVWYVYVIHRRWAVNNKLSRDIMESRDFGEDGDELARELGNFIQ